MAAVCSFVVSNVLFSSYVAVFVSPPPQRSLLIGLQSEAEYGCGAIVLEPGDVLLYYTDGVTEASGIAGDRFDESRLLRILEESCRSGLGAQAILNQLFTRLDRFVGLDHHLEDDASMVVLKVDEALMLPSLNTTLA